MPRTSRLLLACLACGLVLSLGASPVAAHHKDGHAHGGGNSGSQGSQASPSPTPTSTPTPSPTPSSTPSPQPSGGATPGPGGQGPGAGQAAGDLALTTSSEPMLAQVGDPVTYRAVVANTGDEAMDDVAVVASVPEEIALLSVAPVPGVEVSTTGHEVTWTIATLDPGAAVELGWIAHAATAGDLQAVTETSASVPGASAEDSATTFLAASRGVDVDNPPSDTVRKRVVTFVPAPVQPGAAGAPPTLLPVTGAEIGLFTAAGAALLWLGTLLLAAGGQSTRRRSFALLAAVLLTFSACTSETPDQAGPQPQPSPTVEEPGDEEPKDRVKGKRIERKDEGAEDAAAAGDELQPPAVPEEPVGPPELVRMVEIVEVPVEDLPVVPLASRDGDNLMSFTWDLDSRTIVTAASSVRFIAGSPVELLADLGTTGDTLASTVTLTNITTDQRIAVRGHLLLDIYTADGSLVATLESPPIDVVLEPGGTTSSESVYLLEAGDYSARSRFQSN